MNNTALLAERLRQLYLPLPLSKKQRQLGKISVYLVENDF